MLVLTLFLLLVFTGCAFLAERLIPKTVPGDFIVPTVVGITGAILGGSLVHNFGPDLAGISLIPSLFGSISLVSIVCLACRGLPGKQLSAKPIISVL